MSHLPIAFSALVSAPESVGPLDDLTQRIAAQRDLLRAWQAASEDAQRRYARDIAPLHDTYCALLAEQVQRLDVASALPGLSKVERAKLRDVVAEWAGLLAHVSREQAQREAMQDIQRRHAQATAEKARTAPDSVGDVEGADESPSSPNSADSAHANEIGCEADWERDWERAQAAAQQQRAAHHANRKRRQQRANPPAPVAPSLREVYRRVASLLHPDREPDAQRRVTKTAQMQQANWAYAQGDLLGLLSLLHDGQAPGSDALAPYQALLMQQLTELQAAVANAANAFVQQFGAVGVKRLTPEHAVASLRGQAQHLRDAIAWQQAVLRALPVDATGVRRWLREELAARRQHTR